jgi:GMP synthase-like glutamine amidotransferase
MRLHYLQHVPFEDAANIAIWASQRGHTVTRTRLFAEETLPAQSDFDFLAIMGGLMNIYEGKRYSWLVKEKEFIARSIDAKKAILGVCLGAQLIADILGGKVTKNPQKEIGWFPVRLTLAAQQSDIFRSLPIEFTAFHWHGDMFAIPPAAIHLASSQACPNQAFQYGDRVLGIQFHLDYSLDSISKMIQNCGDELTDGPYIQPKNQLLDYDWADIIRLLLYRLLDSFVAGCDNAPLIDRGYRELYHQL